MKTRAQYATSEFEDMSWIKNGAAKMFGYYTSEAEKADKAQLEFSKNLFKIASSDEFNRGLDVIAEKFRPKGNDKNGSGITVLTDKEKREQEKALKREAENS